MYHVEFTPTAESDLTSLDGIVAQRVLRKLRWLSKHIESTKPETLTGYQHGVSKLRVGNYRVLYTVSKDKAIITVHLVRHRREVYRN
jgi:mRNA interferase RelE/StbE